MMNIAPLLLTALFIVIASSDSCAADQLPDVRSTGKDLETPKTVSALPAAGHRVRRVMHGYEKTGVHHTLYLPVNWNPNRWWPVIVEYPGNKYSDATRADFCSGTVEGCKLGYGISSGSNYIWLCLPFLEEGGRRKQNAITWWGNIPETIAYCTNVITFECREFHGDTNAIILSGFSRGAIACNYIGLHDDCIAPIWRGFIACSHYDGVRTNWPYSEADRASALTRLRRLQGRPQCICQESSTDLTEKYLQSTGIAAPFTFVNIPFPNHSDEWVLRKSHARDAVRQWLVSMGLP
jgi:hypothetical protein